MQNKNWVFQDFFKNNKRSRCHQVWRMITIRLRVFCPSTDQRKFHQNRDSKTDNRDLQLDPTKISEISEISNFFQNVKNKFKSPPTEQILEFSNIFQKKQLHDVSKLRRMTYN